LFSIKQNNNAWKETKKKCKRRERKGGERKRKNKLPETHLERTDAEITRERLS
jgi:hypothetical protein